jgi:hypothetical protein
MDVYKQELKPVKPTTQPLLTYEQLNIITAFERLWTSIATWTKTFIESTVFNLPDLQANSNKLYSLPMDFYSIFASYYGTDNSKKFVDLLTGLIMSCMRTTEGMKAGNQDQVNTSTVGWYQACDRLSSFLSSLNVYWDEDQWNNLLYHYTRMKIDEIIATMSGDYMRVIDLYKAMEDLTFLMGSYMARGIIAMSQYQYNNPGNPMQA